MSYICDPFNGIFEIVPRSLHKVGRTLLVAVAVVAKTSCPLLQQMPRDSPVEAQVVGMSSTIVAVWHNEQGVIPFVGPINCT